jgi:hypothetical protein
MTGRAVTVKPAFRVVVPPPGAELVTEIFLEPGIALGEITIEAVPDDGLATLKDAT